MSSIRSQTRFFTWSISLLLTACPLARSAFGLATTQRTIHTFSWGDRVYTCLVIDGGDVPIAPPPVGGPVVSGGGGVTISWPKDGSLAVFRDASKAEAALVDVMGKPEAGDAWKKYMLSRLHGPGYTAQVHDLQADCLDVNHWRIGAITMDYAVGGRESSSLLMLWRCKNGATIAVTLESGPDEFKGHCTEVFGYIGSSIILPPK